MNILQITSDYIPQPLWGMGWHVKQLVDGFGEYGEGHTVFVATANKSKGVHDRIMTTSKSTDKKLLSQNKYEIFNNFEKFLEWQYELAKSVVSQNPDVDIIHCHNWMSWLTAKQIKQKYPDVKVFITFHFLQKQYELMKENPIPTFHKEIIDIEQDAISNADGVIVLSDSQFQLIHEKYLIPHPEKIHLIQHGVNFDIVPFEKLEKVKRTNPEKHIVFLGRIEEDKGIRELLEAFKNVGSHYDRSVILDVVGDGPLLMELQQAKLPNVVFHGYLDRKTIQQLLEAAHIFCLPSTSENLPLTVLEAMFFGVVPIFTNGPTVPTIFESGTHGFTVPLQEKHGAYVSTPHDITEKLLLLLKNNDLLRTMSQNAYEFAVNKYSIKRMIEQIVELYEN